MQPRRTAYLVYNPAAGRGGREDLAVLERALREDVDVRVGETSVDEDADAHARRALALDADVVVAAGGDGTASLVASVLVGTAVPLAVVPRGTACAFAAANGIPSDLEAAVDVIVHGRPCLVDTALANARSMLLAAAIGFHADAVAGTSRELKNRLGVFGYLASGLKHLLGLEPFLVEVETENARVRCRATSVTVANAAPPASVLAQGPASISPADGFLDVTIVADESLTEAVATGLHLWKSALDEAPASRDKVGYLSARTVRLVAEPAARALVDGEPAGTTPLSIVCRPGSLRLMLPDTPSLVRPGPPDLTRLPDVEVQRL